MPKRTIRYRPQLTLEEFEGLKAGDVVIRLGFPSLVTEGPVNLPNFKRKRTAEFSSTKIIRKPFVSLDYSAVRYTAIDVIKDSWLAQRLALEYLEERRGNPVPLLRQLARKKAELMRRLEHLHTTAIPILEELADRYEHERS